MIKKVAVDTSPLISGHKVRGIGVNTRELISAFEKLPKSDFVFGKNKIEVKAVDFSSFDLSNFDLVHYQYFHPFFKTLPLSKPAEKVVLTIHDLIPLIYPSHYPPGVRGRLNFKFQKSRLSDVDRIVTISETSKKDIVKFLSYPQGKIDVIYLAPRDIFKRLATGSWQLEIAKRYDLPDKFVLYVGDINYNKNISTLVEACDSLDLTLVIVGKQAIEIDNLHQKKNLAGPMDWVRFLFGKSHPEVSHLKNLSKIISKSKKVVRLGFVPDNDLVAIYNLATLYVQPSFYEGFGLPLLEAMSCGTPVLASDIGAHREIASDAALFFDPYSVSNLKEKLNEIFSQKDLRKRLVEKGLKRAKDFSWLKTARETLKVYEKILF